LELVKDFSKEEFWNGINDLGKKKALGPDGFNIALFLIVGVLSTRKLWVYLLSTRKVLLRKV